MKDARQILRSITSIDDIKPGPLPGYFLPKLIELGELIINPFDSKSLKNICYYLCLNNCFRRPKAGSKPIYPLNADSIEGAFEPYQEMESYVLEPHKSVICQTLEHLGISNWLQAKLENTTELGRVFINHASHGFIHPGHGIFAPFQLMVELTNLGNRPVVLNCGLPVFRMYIEKLAYPALDFENINITPKLKMNAADRS